MSFLILVIAASAPLIFAAMAGFTSERSGVINIALEGKMLIGCFLCIAVGSKFGSVAGVLAAIIGATLLSGVHWLMTQHYRMDAIISGMAINLLAAGSTNFLKFKFASERLTDLQRLPLEVFYIAAILLPVLVLVLSERTRFGVQLRATGSDPERARLAGLSTTQIRAFSLTFTGIFCGLGGALLATETATFTDRMTSGRGYIGLAALILGGWKPIPSGLACLCFGLATAVQIQFSGQPVLGISIPSEAWKSLPYLVTLVALCGFLMKSKAPDGLGKI